MQMILRVGERCGIKRARHREAQQKRAKDSQFAQDQDPHHGISGQAVKGSPIRGLRFRRLLLRLSIRLRQCQPIPCDYLRL